jgi:hypothetical protein
MISLVRHVRPHSLDRLESLLEGLRAIDALRERSRGVFYRRSKAFIHFHEDGDELFADVRFEDDFERVNVTTEAAQVELLQRVRAVT